MNALVGYTGFVGSNIYEAGDFDCAYNSQNINEAFETNPDLLVYAGLRAEKYLANQAPEKDKELILQAEDNIRRIEPRKVVLVSTVDVFMVPKGVDERSEIDTTGLHAYGYNRYQLERWVREHYPDALIVRLPALFGKNMKKNFIYDLINIIPSMLDKERMEKLCIRDNTLRDYYQLLDNGFYKVVELEAEQKKMLRDKFEVLGFNALNFTDSRSRYQFYPLSRLWKDIQWAMEKGILLWHPSTEPVSAGEIYEYLTGTEFVNELAGVPADYDYRTIYDKEFHGAGGYICDKRTILREIEKVVRQYMD